MSAAVWVLGNASLDLTFHVERLPAPGETLMAAGLARAPGGKGLNQAVVAVRSGVTTHFCAPIGREPEAAAVHRALDKEGFASVALVEVDAPTDLSVLLVGRDAENCIVSTGACADALTVEVAEAFSGRIAAGDLLVVQGNLTAEATLAAARRARDRGAQVMLNTAPLRWDVRRIAACCDVVVANEGEAAEATGAVDPGSAAAVFLGWGAGVAVVTLGSRGCLVANRAASVVFPACPVRAVDTTGAGDTFCGSLAAQLARGLEIRTAIEVAQRAAAIAVSRAGCFVALPTGVELAFLGDRLNDRRGRGGSTRRFDAGP